MANTPSTKKPASKAGKTAGKPRVKKRQPKKAEGSEGKPIIPRVSYSTREQLRKLGGKLSEATDKGMHVAKDVAKRVRHFAGEATGLTKLKIEMHKLKSARDKLLFEMGKKLGNLYNSKKLKDVESIFTDDFKKLEALEADIAKKEKGVAKISL